MLKIYTKVGDKGITAIQGGKKIPKSDLRIKAYGSVDEINSILGVALSQNLDDDLKTLLTKIQNELFVVGADLSNADLTKSEQRITLEMIQQLEQQIDTLEEKLSPITNFILPGGNHIAAIIHLSRTITRRAETHVVGLAEREAINENCIKYLNRLSDLLFVIGRTINKRSDTKDVIWKP